MGARMTEHRPWIGNRYGAGLGGQRVGIVGYSHWNNEGDVDDGGITEYVINNIMSGDFRISFFSSIRNYFGESDHAEFWQKVLFFNYLPTVVGTGDDRYGYGTAQQHLRGRARTLELIETYRAEKVFVFSSKGWSSLKAGFKMPGIQLQPATSAPVGAEIARWTRGQDTTAIAGLRHPQGADGHTMREAVRRVMAI